MNKSHNIRPNKLKSPQQQQQHKKPKIQKKIVQSKSKRHFAISSAPSFGNLSDPDAASEADLPPVSKRSLTKWGFRNPYASDTLVEEDKEKIEAFLKPLGLEKYIEKFTSFDQVLMTQSTILNKEFGMAVKERRLLRRKANHYRVGHYYKTGEIYQPKYPSRPGIAPTRYSRDLSSDDELTFVLPAEEGLYRAHLRYPGASYYGNKLVTSWRYHRAGQGGPLTLTAQERKALTEQFQAVHAPLPDELMDDAPFHLDLTSTDEHSV